MTKLYLFFKSLWIGDKVTEEGFENGFQICTHAIGDMANREVLNIYNEHLKEGNNSLATLIL